MKLFSGFVTLVLSALSIQAHAQVILGANANYGTGLGYAQQGCNQQVQIARAVAQGNDEMKELKKQYAEAAKDLKAKNLELSKAKLAAKRAEGKIGLIFDEDSAVMIKTHVQNTTKKSVTCSSYFSDDKKVADSDKDKSDSGSWDHSPFSDDEWKKACPVTVNDKPNSTLSVELCKMPKHFKSAAAGNDTSGCSSALTDYQRQAAAAARLDAEVAALKDQMEYINDSYKLEMDAYLDDIQSGNVDLSATTESSFCPECERRRAESSGNNGWLSNNMGNLLKMGLGAAIGAISYKVTQNQIDDIASYNASVGYPTDGTKGLAALAGITAGGGLFAQGALGLVTGGGTQVGGAQGSFACGGNAAGWSNGGALGNGNGIYGSGNQWLTGNPYATNGNVNLNTAFQPGFNLYNTNSQFNLNPALSLNGMGAYGSPYASNSPFNIGANGRVQVGPGGYLNSGVAGLINGGVGGAGPNIFGQYSNGGIPNAGVGNGTYYGSPYGAINVQGGVNGGLGGGNALAAALGLGGNGGLGGLGGGVGINGQVGINGALSPLAAILGAIAGGGNGLNGQLGVNGQFGQQVCTQQGCFIVGANGQGGVNGQIGQQVCTQQGCYIVGANGNGMYNGNGYDANQMLLQLQMQQQYLQQQQAQAQAAFQAQQQALQTQLVQQQQAANAQVELQAALQKYYSVVGGLSPSAGGSYLTGQAGYNPGAYIGLNANLNIGGGIGANVVGPGGYLTGSANSYIGGGYNGAGVVGAPTVTVPGSTGIGGRPGR